MPDRAVKWAGAMLIGSGMLHLVVAVTAAHLPKGPMYSRRFIWSSSFARLASADLDRLARGYCDCRDKCRRIRAGRGSG